MATTVSPFADVHAEHAALLRHVEDLRIGADALSSASGHDAFEFIDDSWRFLTDRLIPHATEEERTIYAAFADVTGSPEASRLLSMDHEAIAELVRELGVLRRAAADRVDLPEDVIRGLRRVLYGLYAALRIHFTKEEAVVLPTLERATRRSERTIG
jgi:iron-sulfur cluster repair protein YtfE (RIC family)